MNNPRLPSELVGAAPSPAAHIALLGIVAVIALAVWLTVRRRNTREAAEAHQHLTALEDTPEGQVVLIDEDDQP